MKEREKDQNIKKLRDWEIRAERLRIAMDIWKVGMVSRIYRLDAKTLDKNINKVSNKCLPRVWRVG